MNKKRIVYSINVEDIQTVALKQFGKELNNEEIKLVENKTGDYINWFETIIYTITNTLNLKEIGSGENDD